MHSTATQTFATFGCHLTNISSKRWVVHNPDNAQISQLPLVAADSLASPGCTCRVNTHLNEESALQPVALGAGGADHDTMHQQVLCKVRVRCQHNLCTRHSTARHSTAWHSMGRRSTAQGRAGRTARHNTGQAQQHTAGGRQRNISTAQQSTHTTSH